jgi:EmrB/QacA subfamily drug resistance transporter
VNKSNDTVPIYSQALSRKQVFWTMAGVMIAMLLSALDQTIVGVAMPRIIADLGGFSQYTWATSIYMITAAVTVPIVGKLSDMYGRKIFYIIGIGIFAAFSLACGLSQDMTQLIIFRGFQGIGGGIMMTNAFTVIADIFPPEKRGKYQGLLSSVWSFASVIGPSTGGFLTDSVSWHWVFFINIPISIVAVFIFVKFFPSFKMDSRKHVVDYAGVVALILMVMPVMLALSQGGVDYAWGSPQIIGMFSFSGVMLIVFLFIEMRAKEPIIPLSLFKNRLVSIANSASFLMGMGMFGTFIFIPLFLQGVLGASATASGNMQIPQSIAVMITSIIAGQIVSGKSRRPYRLLGIISMLLICTGMFFLSRLSTSSAYWEVILYIVIMGFGMGVSMPVFTLVIQNSVPYRQLGVATSSINFIRSFGGAIGMSVLGAIMNNHFMPSFINRIPETVKNAVPMDQLTAIAQNPQSLVNPEAQAQLQALLTQPGTDPSVFTSVMNSLQSALSSSITRAFFISFLVLLVGLAVSFFLNPKPGSMADRPDGESDGPPGPR